MDRRSFLIASGVVTGASLVPGAARASTRGTDRPRGARFSDPFTLGIASGDPLPDAVVIWTRLAPDPLAPAGGMPGRRVAVRWEVAKDEGFTKVVRRGAAIARPEEAHSVHVDVHGLSPHRWYWYRFRVGRELSPVGRTRTAPAVGTAPAVLATVNSCSQYEHGYFTAYRRMAEESPDVVFNLGDYIYEYEANDYVAPDGNVRDHIGDEINTLDEYRQRYAQYKGDPDLQFAHAVAPWIVTWDDHEVDNNYADLIPEDRDPEEGNATTASFAARRAAAYKAYWEHMPLRMSRQPSGPDMQLYRRFDFGATARFSVLDTRQYRTDQPCDDQFGVGCGEEFDPQATILGDEQASWLEQNLSSSRSAWNVLPQQIFMANLDAEPAEETPQDPNDGGYNDAWDGYRVSRQRLLSYVADRNIQNFVVLTGDIHSHWLADLRLDFEDPDSPVLGTEFVTTSITSNGDGSDQSSFFPFLAANSPHLRYNSNRRGYLLCTMDKSVYRTDYRVLDYVSRPGAPVRTDASFIVESGRPRAEAV